MGDVKGRSDAPLDTYWIWDIETYPNQFVAVFENLDTGVRYIFEMSERVNDAKQLYWFLTSLINLNHTLIGYNSIGFDYPVIHHFMDLCDESQDAYPGYWPLYLKAQAIIDAPRNDWSQSVAPWEWRLPQIDPYKIMHFDNFARATSLKKLECAMRSATVEDLPVQPGTNVPPDMMGPMVTYCCWDVSETKKFVKLIWDRIMFRFELDDKYLSRKSRMNYNDTRIGKEFFLDELVKEGIQIKNGRQPIQTLHHSGIQVADILLPMEFTHPELKRIYNYFRGAVIPADQTKGFFTDLSADLDGFQLDFGAGGIHASIHKQTMHSTDDKVIIDCDVESYYPSLAIAYRKYPQHLTERFVDIYSDLKTQRISHAKGTAQNAMLKLALNGTYGESNNVHSSFYDSAFTMFITINGQLLLAKLMEMLLENDMVEPIQMNTDGVTVRIPRSHRTWYDSVCQSWSDWCFMKLEYVDYRTMAIRDVNNYISIDVNGKVKRKNAYLTAPDYHQDHSSLVVPKAVSAYVVDGTPLDTYIYTHSDPFDFMRHVKVPRNSKLMHGDVKTQNVCRYYIALDGAPLFRHMPPLKGKDEDRQIGIDKGWSVGLCNKAWDFDWSNLNRRWYLTEAEKLLKGLGL